MNRIVAVVEINYSSKKILVKINRPNIVKINCLYVLRDACITIDDWGYKK
jgi:hypothetical protein